MLGPSRPRTALWSAALVTLALALAGCSGVVSRDKIDQASGTLLGVDVSGTPGTAPTVRISTPLQVPQTRTAEVVTGTGPPVQIDQLFVLQLTLYDARTGRKALSTYDPGQHALAVKSTDDTLFPVLSAALVGKTQGSRIVLAVTGDDAYGAAGAPQLGIGAGDPVVLVADVAAVAPRTVLNGPQGTPVPRPGGPAVRIVDGLPEAVLTSGRRPPRRLLVRTLVRGSGPAVGAVSLVTLHALGQVWGRRLPFEDSYFKEPLTVPFGTGQVVAAWQRALVGVPVGSRVLLVAPPALAYGAAGDPPQVPGGATIAWVIDVLGVS